MCYRHQRDNLSKKPKLEIYWKTLSLALQQQICSVCEDSAYNMTKGLTQRFLIGKSDPNDPSEDDDTAEIETIEEKSPIPDDDEDISDEGYARCMNALIGRPKEVDIGWLGLDASATNRYDLPSGDLEKFLPQSHERAWWLRKCCTKTAKFVPESEEYKKGKGVWEADESRRNALSEAKVELEQVKKADMKAKDANKPFP